MNFKDPSAPSIRFAIFGSFDTQILRRLGGTAQKLTFREGESFLLTGDLERSVFLLEYGRLQHKSPDLLDHVEPGAVFGETRPVMMRGVALETSCVWVIPRSEFDGLLRAGTDWALRLKRKVGQFFAPELALTHPVRAHGDPPVPPRFVLVDSGFDVPLRCDGLIARESRITRAKWGTGQAGGNGSWRGSRGS